MSVAAGRRSSDGVLAIDVGTSAVKAAVIGYDAVPRSVAPVRQRIHTDPGGASEHDPVRVLAATRRAIGEAVAGSTGTRIAAVAITGPRGTFLVAGPDGAPRTPFLTWQDSRGAAEANRLRTDGPRDYRAIAGIEPDASSVLPRLLWLRRASPHVFESVWRLRTPQGLVCGELGGDADTVDQTAAAHVGLLDVHELRWSARLLSAFDINEASLPRVVEPGSTVGIVGSRAAARLGLPAGIPIVTAAADGICSELGAGVARPGQLYAYLGTAGAFAGPIDAVNADPRLATRLPEGLFMMPGAVPSLRRLVGLTRAGASAVDWYMRSSGVRTHARFEALAGVSDPGARGALFVPALAGDGVIVPDSNARGAFVGLSLATKRTDLARAVLEGVALELRVAADRIAQVGVRATSVTLTGGGSRSDLWSQIVCDVLGVPVMRCRDPNPGLRGAALFALDALGVAESVPDLATRLAASVDRFEPDDSLAGIYAKRVKVLESIRRALHDSDLDAAIAVGAAPTAETHDDAVV